MNLPKTQNNKSALQDKANELIEQIETLVFKGNHYSDDVMLKTSLDYLKAKLELKNADEQILKRFEELREGALAIANLSFSKPIPVTEEDDIFNYFATLLNHLSQALQLKLYDGESFAAVTGGEEVNRLKNATIELLNFYRFHKIFTQSPGQDKYKESFQLLEDFAAADDMFKLSIKYGMNPNSLEAGIESIISSLSKIELKEKYTQWMKENFPIRVLTNKQFKLIESEIKYDTITKMALKYNAYSQLDFLAVKNNLEKPIISIGLAKGLVKKLSALHITQVKDFIKYSWNELCEKSKLNTREKQQLSDKLTELNCITLLDDNSCFMLKNTGLVVSQDIK